MKQITWGKRLTLAALGAVLGTASFLTPAQAASATTTAPLTLRAGTSTSTSALATIPSGAAINVTCQAKGQAISGTYNSDWWAKVTYNGHTGYASRAYIRVPYGSNVPTCGSSPAPEPGGSVNAWTPHTVGAPISRELVIARAKFWADKRLPYNWDVSYKDPQGKYYRADCSGMVSMALHLSGSPTTVGLRDYVYPISKSQLRPGDIVGNLGPGTGGANGHVVIFNGWVPNTNQTRFYTLEQQGGVGAIAQSRPWGTSYWNVQGWRYNHISN